MTSRPGDEADKQVALFGRMPIKVLAPGPLYDSFVKILGEPARKSGGPQADSRAEFIQFFSDDGDPDPKAYRRGIPHLLRQMNSSQFGGRNLASLAANLTGRGRTEDDVAKDLFLRILSRYPTEEEQKLFHSAVANAGSLEAGTREFAWALLATSEFSCNH